MSHPFGDLVSQHLHRKHGLSQSKLAEGILQAPTVVSAMCKGRRLVGPQARERIVAIIGWLHQHGALDTLDEADALLNAAGMSGLNRSNADEVALGHMLHPLSNQSNDEDAGFTPPFGQWLKKRRKQLDLTQGDLARRVGYSPETIRKIEADVLKPSKQIVDLLADHIGVPSSKRDAFHAFATDSRTAKPRSRPTRPQRRHNLPAPLTSFIGREKEIEGIAAQVRTHRLVTLTGTGGIGKTRLALEVAGGSLDVFHDGIWLINLVPVSDPALVPQIIVAALKLVEQPGRNPLDILTGYLEERHALLILDNCEHVIDACAALVDQLRGRCPELHVLATSRETLRVPGEITHRVASLALPDDASAMQSAESVALFVDRARASQPAFDLDATNASAVARICRQLAGIPLAIELAAALLSSMSVAEAANLLSDRLSPTANGFRAVASRHQTMRAALDWSYDLLSPDEQRVLARLSVFSGGWMLEQAQVVCGDDDVVETRTITSLLVHKSLVLAEPQGEHTRYRLLEPIRQYAAEKLDETGEADAVRQQHALAYLALAQAAEPHLHAHQQRRWLDWLEREHDNFRAALTWCQSESGDAGLGLQLAVALWQFWWLRSHAGEGRRWIDALLEMASPKTSPAVRAWALLGMGILGQGVYGNYAPSLSSSRFEEALTLFRVIGDDAGIALALCELSAPLPGLSKLRHQLTRTQPIIQESLTISRRQNEHPWVTTHILERLAFVTYWCTDLPRATALCAECLASARQQGNAQSIAASLNLMADILGAQLQYARAAALAEEALLISREMGEALHELNALIQLADELRFMGEFERAIALIEEVHRRSIMHNHLDNIGWTLTMFGLIARDQGDFTRATSRFKESIHWYRDKLDTWGSWFNVLGLGTVATLQEQPLRAARLYGAAEAWQASVNLLRFPHNQRQFGTYIEATRAELGEAAYSAAFEEGRAMTPEQAFNYALSHQDEDEPA